MCQPWTSTSSHQHLLQLEDYPEILGDHNYCRNPGDRGERPWCFTTDEEMRWEYCNITECGQSLFEGREGGSEGGTQLLW